MLDFINLQFPSVGNGTQFNDISNVLCEELLLASQREMRRRLQQQNQSDNETNASSDEEGQGPVERASESQSTWRFLSPVDIYRAFMVLRPRLHFLTNLLMSKSSLISHYAKILDRQANEFNSDVQLFEILLNEMAPKVAELKTPNQVAEWSGQVDKACALFHSLKNCVSATHKYKIGQLQMVLNKYNIMKCFLSHIGQDQEDLALPDAVLNRVYVSLKSNDLKTGPQLEKFIKQLHMANKESIKHYFTKDSDLCILCDEDFEKNGSVPVELPCGHVGCKSCLQEHFEEKGAGITVFF